MRIEAGGCGPLATGAVASADLALLGQLPVNFLPVEKNIGVQTAQIAFLLCLQGVVANAPEGELAPAAFHREIAEALPGCNKGATLWTFHFPPLFFRQYAGI